jgi:hypothetical protein
MGRLEPPTLPANLPDHSSGRADSADARAADASKIIDL